MELLYRDEDIAVFDKPAGLITHRSAMANDADNALVRARDIVHTYVWPLHRLDRATSGVIAFALSEESARALRVVFDEGRVKKLYWAIARGRAPEQVLVDHPIPKGEGKERVPAVTAFRTLAADDRVSLVEAAPQTGRYHQVRRHLSHLRHPIAGDTNYGTGWFNRWMRVEAGLLRLGLHALSIELPTRNGPTTIAAPLAPDMASALTRLGIAP